MLNSNSNVIFLTTIIHRFVRSIKAAMINLELLFNRLRIAIRLIKDCSSLRPYTNSNPKVFLKTSIICRFIRSIKAAMINLELLNRLWMNVRMIKVTSDVVRNLDNSLKYLRRRRLIS